MKKVRVPFIGDSLYARLTFLVMLTVFIVFAVITIILTRVVRQGLLESSKENAMGNMEIANLHIGSTLMSVEAVVANVVPNISKTLDRPDQLYEVVAEMVAANRNIIGSAIAFEPNYFPQKGVYFSPYAYRTVNNTVLTKQLGNEEYEYHYMDWYQIPKLLKKSYWSEPYYDMGGGEQMMTTYSLPIYDTDGQFIAILTADVSLNWLTEIVKKNDLRINSKILKRESADTMDNVINNEFLANHAYSFVVGRGGTYITHPMTERILNETYFSYAIETEDSADLQVGYNMIDGLSGMNIINRDGVEYALCYAPIERTGWSMCTVMPARLIFDRARLHSIFVILIMIAGLIALFYICNSLMKRITRPLERFTESADEISKGNLDASLPEITTKDEMKRLHDSFQAMQTSLKHQMQELEQTTASKTAIESELKVASQIQMSMLPKIFPPYPDRDDVDIFGQLTPAKAVGGDLFDYFIRDEKLFFCIGDVSGKGVPAALVMAVTRAQFRTVSTLESIPDRIVHRLNNTMCEGNDSIMFVTLFVGVLDLPTGRLRYCNAGHDAPLLIGEDVSELPCESNLPIGVMADWTFKLQEVEISPMTTIFLFTDGLTEAENGKREQFASKRIMDMAQASLKTSHQPEKLIAMMTNAVKSFVNGADQSDDLTMLAIQYTKQQQDEKYHEKLILSNDIEEVPQLAEFVTETCNAIGIDESTTMSFNLALEEAVVNVMSYAYPHNTKGLISIEAMANDSKLKFVISDNGVPFDPTLVPEVDTTLSAEERSVGGLGIFMVRKLMDSVNYERVGGFNVLTLRKKLK